ncbi:TerC family protein [Olivibacter sitiensis]|uniref:TerC family protein n=1 Tax=Olivibacter sitiensis TaxID=376470 RepID=UPI0003F730FD|nr:TerC family protein [Olivibacter sitiensis]
MSNEILFFASFLLFIAAMLAIDLGVFNKKDHVVSLKEAGIMSAVWVLFALGFFVILRYYGDRLHDINDFARLAEVTKSHMHQIKLDASDFAGSLQIYKHNLSVEFITGYVVEYALSVDNIFVMVLIFSSFGVPPQYYHRVLVWGILGAIVMRFIFIFLGAALIARFDWILYVFGVFLIYTGINMFINRNKEEEIDPKEHKVVKFASRYFSVYPDFVGHNFTHKENGKKYITPLLLVLLVIEFTDLIFAVDSIPAIFAVTKDPYIVFFSNIFAILGLRSMFFLLVGIIDKFHYLKVGLAFLLVFIGGKMLVHHWLESVGFSTAHSLYIIVGILAVSVIASLLFPKKDEVTA